MGIRTHEIIPADTVIWQPVLNNRHKVWSAPNNDTPGYNYTIAYYNIYGMKTNGYLYFIYPKKVKYARIRD